RTRNRASCSAPHSLRSDDRRLTANDTRRCGRPRLLHRPPARLAQSDIPNFVDPTSDSGVGASHPTHGATAGNRNPTSPSNKKAGACRPKDWGIEPYADLWPDPSTPRGAGGLRNPECDPDRALRQRSITSQSSLARAWLKWGRIMIRLTNP